MMPRSPAPAVISAVALIVLFLGVWGNWWFGGEQKLELMDEDMSMRMDFGLRGASVCQGDKCAEANFSSIPMPDDDDLDDEAAAQVKRFKRYVWAGGATFWSGMITVVAMAGAVLLWMLRLRMPVSIPGIGGALALCTAVLGTIAFGLKPVLPEQSEMMKLDFSMGVGYPLTLLGAVGCAIGGFFLVKEEKGFQRVGAGPGYYSGMPMMPPGQGPMMPPQGPMMGGPAPGPTVSPACPRCAAPMVFVAEHQRHFCASCRAYV